MQEAANHSYRTVQQPCGSRKGDGKMAHLRTITIERQYASGGREIGKRLSERLGIPFYDGQLLMLAAEKYGLNPGVVKANDEKVNKSLLYTVASAVENFRGNEKQEL